VIRLPSANLVGSGNIENQRKEAHGQVNK